MLGDETIRGIPGVSVTAENLHYELFKIQFHKLEEIIVKFKSIIDEIPKKHFKNYALTNVCKK